MASGAGRLQRMEAKATAYLERDCEDDDDDDDLRAVPEGALGRVRRSGA